MATYVAAKSATVTEAGDHGDPVADLQAAWQMHVKFGLANPELYALLNPPARSRPSPATAAGIEVLRARMHRLAAAGLLRVDEERAVMMIHAAGSGTVLALLGSPGDQRDLSLSEAMFDAVAAAILTTAPPAPDTRLRSIAILFATMVADLPALTDAERTLMTEWLSRSIAHLQRS
jgi:hypothetical protein